MKTKLLLVLLALLLPLMVSASTEIDGVYYNLTNNSEGCYAEVTNSEGGALSVEYYSPYNGSIIIPKTVVLDNISYLVTSIGDWAFCGSQRLTSVTIPNSVTSIGDWAFSGCSLTSVTIPNSVTSIGTCAFVGCSSLASVTIPNSVTAIGDGSFDGCEGLISITIPNSVTSIGSSAFKYCSGLTSIIIGSSVTSIDAFAFFGCNKVVDVYFLGKMAPSTSNEYPSFPKEQFCNTNLHVKDYAIESFKGIEPWIYFKEIVCDEKITDFKLTYYVDGEVYKTETHKYEDKIVLEAEPTRKGMTFSGWDIDIPEKMPGKDVEVRGTFSWSKLTKEGILYQVYQAEKELADVCGSDNASGEVNIISPVEIDGYKYSVTDIVDFSFKNNTDITSVVIPESVRKIGDEAFYGCKNLVKVEFGKSVDQIEPRAFANIDKLTDVTIRAEEVPETDRTAFENSYIEDYVTLHVPYGSLDKYKAAAPWKNFKEIVVIPGTEVIEKYKLTYMVDGEEYKVVEINEGEAVTPEDVPTKEGYTFSGWSDIPETMPAKDVTVSGTFTVNKYKLTYTVDGDSYKEYEVEYGSAITAESDPTKEGYTFSGWSDIPGTMPANDVTVTGYFTKAVYEVDGASYEINDDGMTLTKGEDASGDVVLDATVTINGKTYYVTVIGDGAFQGNQNITSLTVPEGFETIGNNAFDGCSALNKLTIGRNIKYIGSRAFAGIGKSNARNRAASEPLVIECEADYIPGAETDCFDGTPVESAILKVNDDLVSQYKSTSPWNRFGTIIGFNEAKEAGISSVIADEPGTMLFSTDGRRLNKPENGMNIIRTSTGTKKVMIK